MSNQSRGGRGRGRGPLPGRELNQHVSQCCYNLGINFPPNPNEAWPRMMYFKDCGQDCLNTKRYDYALNNYTLALQVAELFPGQPQFRDEAIKILCNRSLVFFQMSHYQDALNDATTAISVGPTFLKGYWRGYQAARRICDDHALPFVSEGLQVAMGVGSTPQDIISFLTELCTLVQNMQNLRYPVLDALRVPDISDTQIWTKTLKTLVGNKCWDSLRMLLLGNSGPICLLRGFCRNYDFSGFDISGLLDVSFINQKIWGILLVEKFFELGASLEKIEEQFGMPALHVCTNLAVKTDSVQLIEAILHRHKDSPKAINITNSKGQTALHQAVLSDKVNQPAGERIVRTLLNYRCDPNLRDNEGKQPIDYVMQGTNVFMIIKNATKSVAELKQELEAVKQRGNEALKRNDTIEALRLYEEALDISNKSKELYKEAAVVYSNRAKVFNTLKRSEDALTNALAAVSCDPTYQKGHWWKGKIMCQMGAIKEGFLSYVDGFIQSAANSDEKLLFVTEAVMQLLQLQESALVSCYNELRRIKDKDVWTRALQKLASSGEWQCIIYLLLGPNLDQKPFKICPTANEIMQVNSGVACNSPRECLDLGTVFDYLRRKPFSQCDYYWLDVLLVTIYVRMNRAAFNKFVENEQDNYLHAATRFTLFTERFFLLETILKQPLAAMKDQIINGHGDTVYHTITKILPLPSEKTLVRVTQMFMTKRISTMVKNNNGKLAVDHLDKKYSGKVFDLFFKKVVPFSWDEVNLLKEKGNQKYKSGDIQDAVELYTEAVDMLKSQSTNQLKGSASKDVSILYGNRAEGYLKLGQYEYALDDAKMCVSYNTHWYKAHLRVAKALKGQKKMENSLNSYITAYKDVEASMDDSVRIEILSEMTLIYQQMAPRTFDAKIHNNFAKGQGHVWLKTSYELIRKDDWDRAHIAYDYFISATGKRPHITYTLAPICKLEKMRVHPWSVDLIQHLLNLGADKRTLTLNKGDTYLHAAVRISLLIVKNGLLLKWLLKEYKELNLIDKDGNTPLHIAAKERGVTTEIRYNIIMVLLKANVDANVKNVKGELAIDIIPGQQHSGTTDLMENLRMAMYRGKTMKQGPSFASQQGQRTQTTQPQKTTKILKRNCEECNDLLRDAHRLFDKDNATEGYIKLSEIFEKQHKTDNHESIVNKAVAAIVEKVGEKSVPEIPSSLTGIGKEFYQLVADGLIIKKKWQQLNSIVRKYRLVKGQDQFKGFASNLSIVPVIRDPLLKDAEEDQVQIIANMLNSGASMGTDNGQTALSLAKELDHYKLVTDLIKKGADTSHFTMNKGDTPIHAVVKMILEKEKAMHLLEFVFDQYESNPDRFPHLNPCQQNKAGDSLFHLVAKGKCTNHVVKVTEFLCKRKLSAGYCNKDGKLPNAYITKPNDRRVQYIRLAATVVPVGQQIFRKDRNPDKSKSECKEEEDSSSEEELNDFQRGGGEEGSMDGNIVEKARLENERDKMKHRITELIRILPEYKTAKPEVQHDVHVDDEAGVSENETRNVEGIEERKVVNHDNEAERGDIKVEKTVQGNEDNVIEKVGNVAEDSNSDDDDDEEEEEEDLEEAIDAEVFDNLEWEVECTQEVWKTLQDKHVLPELKNRIVNKIQKLASGNWHPVLCKKLRNVPKTLDLFEAKFSKGSRIIWEKAIAFSPRCSESAERRLQLDTDDTSQAVLGGRIYSEIIRVWEIVFDHDKIHRSVERIKQSHHRGGECIIQKGLRGIKTDPSQLNLNQGRQIYPKMFAESDVPVDRIVEQQEELQHYFPPASSNETEYHILKFYSVTSTLVGHILQNIDTKVDFPFRVTDLEHAIINLPSKSPILLLGRSGTGKTTCCLYRLWSQFHGYWNKAKEADAPLLPRCVGYVHTKSPEEGIQEDESDGSDGEVSESEDEGKVGQSVMTGGDLNDEPIRVQYDHIHQLFITKNLVLCSEVQKNFRELSHAEELMREHVEHEEEELPNKLQDAGDYSYPMFLTSRQLLLMLDASIGPPYFFNRKDDGSMKADVEGWSDDGPLSILSLLEEDSDSENEDRNQFEEDDEDPELEILQASTKKNKLDPRREITYHVFVEEIWPKIKKKLSFHPSLVWTEIMSFIKGSFEALSVRNGYLSLEEYGKLGKKRAPNFSADREPIHRCFKRYEHFKKQHQLFDETDLVFNIYGRLRKMENQPWVIHQIYVDETQDFTQAELCLLIRICQNPNDMFLTGDTAQSIMRGIAFRFSDLKSLFYHAKKSMVAMGKISAVEAPKKVYQLTHNYRSHAGILSLASSVLEIMVEFFPESFDRLQRDQGLFNGPQPILLESCSFSDLAVLLRGNKRKTSHIEFGAHQAILVVNEAARDAIPEELRLGLVLTIYEAKGLEFDDVLLYNFFKDSQAVKEWRVVTEYLERLLVTQKENIEQDRQQYSLVEIDEDVLRQPDRPRPLNFDPNLHKVLNSELKHLYTALTRARVNVWIFDADDDNRAPMFEYFRARKLVKSITVTDIDEENLVETVFAEKSSVEDWIRQGEDFMRHSLYSIAAKCFGIAGETDRQKVALAHAQAVKASKLKNNPREMRQEFLEAAEMYLNCSKPAKAAICLQNARERELAARLFEKLGQYEQAADIYKKLRQSIASSRCYEQQGLFNKAVEVLYESENYRMAIDTLRRYEMRVKENSEENTPMPGYLVAYKPADYYTEEKLSHRAAEKFHKLGYKDSMLSAIDSIPKVGDRVEFLEKKGYIKEAAIILQDNDELKKATNLLLKHGLTDDATEIARRTHDQGILGHCILVSSRIFMSTRKERVNSPDDKPTLKNEEMLKSMAEGVELLGACKCNDQFGELRLLQAELSLHQDNVKEAWKSFSGSKPVQNDAGLIECGDWLMRYSSLDTLQNVKRLINCVGFTFTVCVVLSKPNEAANWDKVHKYLQLYGLYHSSQTEFVFYPKQRPLCLEILQSFMKISDAERSNSYVVDKEDAYQSIMKFLLKRTLQWTEQIWIALFNMRDRSKMCNYFCAGLECPNFGNVDNNCYRCHIPMSNESMLSLVDTDLLLVELEDEIQEGAYRLKRTCPAVLKVSVDQFLEEGERDPSEKYKACRYMLDDLMPYAGHPLQIGEDSEELVKYLQKNTKILRHFRDFLMDQWKVKTTTPGKASNCQAAKETQVIFLFEFGYHLFGLDSKVRIDQSPRQCLEKLERDIDFEGALNLKRFHLYTLVTYTRGNRMYVQCIAKRFMEAYSFISLNRNPYEAVFQFSKFVVLQRTKRSISQLPDLHHYCMWIEFFLTVAIILTAKLKTRDFPDFLFILPSAYLKLVKFIEATFPNPRLARVVTGIDNWHPKYPNNYQKDTSSLQDRLKYISFGVCGLNHYINILEEALKRSLGDPHFYAVAERIIVLHMLLILNVGKAMPAESEISLMKSLAGITIPQEGPDRLQRLEKYIKHKVKGIADVAAALDSLLKARMQGEELLVCKWGQNIRQRIVTSKLENEKLFSPTFLNPKTESVMLHIGPIDTIEEIESVLEEELTQEEIDKSVQEKQELEAREKSNEAAVKITNFFKRHTAMKKARRDIVQRKKRELVHGEFKLFDTVKITDTHCGFCGIYFENLVKEAIDLEQSVVIGAQSIMNTSNSNAPTSMEPNVTQSDYPSSWGMGNNSQDMPNIFGDANNQPSYFMNTPTSPEIGGHGDRASFVQWQRSVSNEDRIDYQSLLMRKKKEHQQHEAHVAKELEFEIFKKKCRTKILPKLATIREFFDNDDFRLEDKDYVLKNYDHRYMEAERMQTMLAKIDTDILHLFQTRDWSQLGAIEQHLMELGSDFDLVRPYVEEVSNKLKEERDEQLRKSKAGSANPRFKEEVDGEEDEDDDEFEEVVQAPRTKNKYKIYNNSKRKKRWNRMT